MAVSTSTLRIPVSQTTGLLVLVSQSKKLPPPPPPAAAAAAAIAERPCVGRSLNDTELLHYDRQVNVMRRGAFIGIKYGSQAMMVTSADKPQPAGAFVVTRSCASFLGSYSDLPYAVAKTALHGLISGASVHLLSSNIGVNGVAPGFTKSGILSNSQKAEQGEYKATEYYYNRLQDPAEVANVQVFLTSNISSCIYGQMVLCDSGKTAAATGEACTGSIPPVKPLDLC
ncbi:hypothetical protein A1O3_01812 [Capronia epimyces CBS 606.96]|uniref:3-oxoacyl-[acyl-carrier protein] reductase n=1 Tax=Capronia epimyces CBS 606.96 TaxID=1182542 RepID=W9YU85_9EURO|nr:uncharacterized protein A1O3_01812 [Capronia epimyces CBS 606.96]EXJ93255.1 hypothetical protein A1O3_01812 [Capronia epimyces CBS 606.96]